MKTITLFLIPFLGLFTCFVNAQVLQMHYYPGNIREVESNKLAEFGISRIESSDSGNCGNPFYGNFREFAELDEKGRMLQRSLNPGNENFEQSEQFFYSTHSGPDSILSGFGNGKLVEKFLYNQEGKLLSDEKLLLNSMGPNEREETKYYYDNIARRTFSTEKLWIGALMTDNQGKIIPEKRMLWRLDNGNERVFFYSDDDSVPSYWMYRSEPGDNGDMSSSITECEYDKSGNPIGEISYNLHFNSKSNSQFSSYSSRTNVRKGNRIETFVKDKSGKVFHYTRSFRDEKGRVIRTEGIESGYPSGTYFAVEEYFYNELGLLKETQKRWLEIGDGISEVNWNFAKKAMAHPVCHTVKYRYLK